MILRWRIIWCRWRRFNILFKKLNGLALIIRRSPLSAAQPLREPYAVGGTHLAAKPPKYVKWAIKLDFNIRFELSLNPGELSRINPQKCHIFQRQNIGPSWAPQLLLKSRYKKMSPQRFWSKSLKFFLSKIGPSTAALRKSVFLVKKSKILAVKKFVFAWARQGWISRLWKKMGRGGFGVAEHAEKRISTIRHSYVAVVKIEGLKNGPHRKKPI